MLKLYTESVLCFVHFLAYNSNFGVASGCTQFKFKQFLIEQNSAYAKCRHSAW